MADDDFDLYGEDDGFNSSQVQVGLMLFVIPSNLGVNQVEKRPE
jgi:hypothetical protein